MKYDVVRKYVDLVFCIIVLPLIIALVPVQKWLVKYPSFAVTLIVFLYALYFSMRLMRLPEKILQKRYLPVVIFSIVGLFLTFLLSRFPYPDHLLAREAVSGVHIKVRSQTVWLLSLVVSAYSFSVSLLLELLKENQNKRELEEKKNKAELELYKAQINPHFLFNTLNTLYGLIISKSDKAEAAFVRFSDLLKYTYTRIGAELVAVSDELDYVTGYIELQRLRLNHHTTVELKTDIKDFSFWIPPMILISFVENAFKYGTSSHRDCEIFISLSVKEGELAFECRNDIMNPPQDKKEVAVGLENTRGRLRLLYPGRHHMETIEKEGRYYVFLNIKTK